MRAEAWARPCPGLTPRVPLPWVRTPPAPKPEATETAGPVLRLATRRAVEDPSVSPPHQATRPGPHAAGLRQRWGKATHMPSRSTSPKPPARLPSGRRRWGPACPHPELTLPRNEAGPSHWHLPWGADGQEPTPPPTQGSTQAPAPQLLIWKSVVPVGPVFMYLAFHTQFSAWAAYGVPCAARGTPRTPTRPPGPAEA